MVIDTSALLAVLFREAHGPWVAAQLEANAESLLMSTVNLAEALVRIRSVHPEPAAVEVQLFDLAIAFVAPDVDQARLAADARRRYPLNFGDCFAYALARAAGVAVLTTDRDFRNVDCEVVAPPAA